MKTAMILVTLVSLSFGQLIGWNGWSGYGGWNDEAKGLLDEDASTIAHWWFNSTNKDTLKNLTGNGHDLTPSSGFDYQDQFTDAAPGGGNALHFDGVDDALYLPSSTDSLVFDDGYTIEFIAQYEDETSSKYYTASYDGLSSFGFTVYGLANSPSIITYVIESTGYVTVTIDAHASQGDWIYYVLSVERGVVLNIYVFGGTADVKMSEVPKARGTDNSMTSLTIGARGYNTAFAERTFSEYKVSNKAKTASEVQAQWEKIKDEL